MKEKLTISKLAKELGVSRQTMSKYLRDYPHLKKHLHILIRGRKKFYIVADKDSFVKELSKLGFNIPNREV